MTDNIKSLRIEYKDFKVENDVAEDPYYLALQKPLKRKSVFLFANRKSVLKGFLRVSEWLQKFGYTVYTLPVVAKKIPGAVAVESKSDEYYNAVATSRYIIALDYLPPFFLARRGQYVFSAVDKRAKSLADRISISKTDVRTDFYIKTRIHPNGLTSKKLLLSLLFPILLKYFSAKKKTSSKKELLFIANLLHKDNSLEIFRRMAATYKNANITLLIDHIAVRKYEDELAALDDSITILTKQGKFIRSVEDGNRIEFLNKEFYFLENPDEVKSFVPKYVFDYERRRLFGNKHFDKAVNLMHNTFYWIETVKDACDEYVHVDGAGFANLADDERASRSRIMCRFNKVYFTRRDRLDMAVEDYEGIKDKAQLLPY